MLGRISYTFFVVSLFAIQLVLFSCCRNNDQIAEETRPASTEQTDARGSNALLVFGNPSNAVSGDDKDNYLVIHRSHILSYNNSRGTMNWIAWRTRRSDLGESRERPDFEADATLPPNFIRVRYYDYSGSGYQRGHMLPSADRFSDAGLNAETFLMTNIVPQTGGLNEFVWEKLERHARRLIGQGRETYTIAGVYGDKGKLKNRVTVPTNCWKVIVIFDRGQSVNAIDTKTKIIAVDMPNIDGIERIAWQNYVTTIDAIEGRTGLDLFALLPDDVENAIESRTSETKNH